MSMEREVWIQVALSKAEEILNDTILGEQNLSNHPIL